MKLVVTGSFPPEIREQIRSCFPEEWTLRLVPPEELEGELVDAEVLIPEHLRLRLVQTGAGFDNVDQEACARRGIRVCSAPGVNAQAVAEHVMAFLLCWYKNILPLDGFLKARREERELRYTGAELSEKTIGIVGFGHVGRKLAPLCLAFGMRVLAAGTGPIDCPGVLQRDLDSLLRESTRGLIGASALAAMKRDALLINTSRGPVLDEEALIRALQRREIGGACLDVFADEPLPLSSPLRDLPNVILTPHTAGLPDGVRFHRRRYLFFAENIRRVLEEQPPRPQPPAGEERISLRTE